MLSRLASVFLFLSAALCMAAEKEASTLFERRILPILRSPDPSSCSDCHLSGVDLKQYIGKDAASTFAALRDQGLIDVERPEKSELLALIAKEPERPTIVSTEARKQELEAFREWIRAAASDPELRDAPGGNEKLGPRLPEEVIAHTREDHVVERFVDLVWSEVERCAGCHSPLLNKKQVEEHGEQVSWIVPDDPAATLDLIVDHELIDLETPEKSLLLLKPTKQVDHGGGIKLIVGDRTYSRFRAFLEDYAKSRKAGYQRNSELPRLPDDVTATTDVWLRIEDLPEAYVGKLLAVELYPEVDGKWADTPAAVADRYVYPPSPAWQQHLSLFAPRSSSRAKELRAPGRDALQLLPRGKCLMKVYVDQTQRLKREYPTQVGAKEYVGEFVFEPAWTIGYGGMTTVPFAAREPAK